MQRKTNLTGDEGAQRLRFVNACVVEDHCDLPSHMSEQMGQEMDDLSALDGGLLSLLQELACRRDRPNRRNLVPIGFGVEHWALPTRRPGPRYRGFQTETHFV